MHYETRHARKPDARDFNESTEGQMSMGRKD